MPTVQGSLLDIAGDALAANIAQLVFRLNGPNIVATGSNAGNVHPTKEEPVTPTGAGAFSVNLADTTNMHMNAWYDIGIRWNESEGTFWDFGLKIRVPSGGPHNIGDLFFNGPNGGSGANQLLVWVSETQPLSKARGQWWFKPSTQNLYRWE